MTLQAGRQLLHYRLIEKIGEGGMGVVWKAVDTSLDREVAIKVLPAEFAEDRARLARFEREARLVASLSHPNIAVVHGLHADQGLRFLAMELVAGEDLSRRLARGPLPLDEALGVAAQIADALEAAHDSGVVHRDLKPANVQLDEQGSVKVLDFGLAKAFQGDPSAPTTSPTMSPTVTSTGTLAGTILGTAAYMSPEQAKGKPLDKRADIWAFGCVVLEMLTGSQTFKAESIAETLAQVIKEDPDWCRLPEDTPPSIHRLLRRCLVKDPRRRLRDIGDARIVIAEHQAGEGLDDTSEASSPSTSRPTPAWQRLLPWGVTLLLAAALAATWLGPDRGPSVTPATGGGASPHLSVMLPDDAPALLVNSDLEILPSFAISPRGDRLAYTARAGTGNMTGGGARVLRLRSLDDFAGRPLRGTEDAEGPFFSPDGRWIGYFHGTTLAKVPATGGARIDLVTGIGNGVGADWSSDGTIVFSHSYVGPLWTVPESGGEPRPLTILGENERSHRYPQFLPDGKSVLFTIKPSGILSFDDAHIAVADLRSGKHKVLAERGSYARYLPSGRLVYARDGALLAAPFDLRSLSTTGGAVPVLEGAMTSPITGTGQFEVSDNGTLVYVPGDYSAGPGEAFAVDRATGGRRALAPDYYASSPRLSPDGRSLLLHGSAANEVVLLADLERGTVRRVTDASTNDILPIWGPAGQRIVYTKDEERIVWVNLDGREIETLVDRRGRRQVASSWSPDGALLAFIAGTGAGRDIHILDRRTGQAAPFLETPFDEGEPRFSPDGDWIIHESDESGRSEIYATAYPGPGARVQLSTGGGSLPRLRGDGGELFYQSGAEIVAAPLTWDRGPRAGAPRAVVELGSTIPLGYDVAADGKTFYIVELHEELWFSDRIEVVLNWTSELVQLVP